KENSHAFAPGLDLWETTEEYKLRLDLPGIPKEAVDISVLDRTITIKGERKAEKAEAATFYKNEISYGTFERQVALPRDINPDEIKAAFTDGVLELTIPKQEKVKNIKISIN